MLCDVLFRPIAGSMKVCVRLLESPETYATAQGKARDMSMFQGPTQPAVRPKPPAAIEECRDCRGPWGSDQGRGFCPPGVWGGGRPPLCPPMLPRKVAQSFPGPTCALDHLGRMLHGEAVSLLPMRMV